ncbi:MAG TPA: ABC transporter ATP-binding protein [Acetobacteraceae bacterium]|nr:ABC transporter ATP-binding protein [Acetobacteraceae bacterium]
MAAEPPAPLLAIEGLQVCVRGGRPIIDGLDLEIAPGEIVALVGESGCGKSITAMSIMRLLPPGGRIAAGSIRLRGDDLLAKSAREMNRIRGGRIGMLFQQPQIMLDPTARVGAQVAEPLRLHRNLSRAAALERVVALLREVGIAEPRLRARCFAAELSGGMAQRVMIAAALSGDPELLIADEPTTALDVTVQAQILRLLVHERNARGLAILLITHDLAVVSAVADRVVVMYAGRAVEEGAAATILRRPQHPYTQALVRCSLLQLDGAGQLVSIPGAAAEASSVTGGCRFHPRCGTAAGLGLSACHEHEPPLEAYAEGARARCWAVGVR